MSDRLPACAAGAEVVVGRPKSKAGEQVIPVDADPDMPSALRRHRKRQAADRLAAGGVGGVRPACHGRARPDGRAVAADAPVQEVIGEAGVPPIVPDGGRHTVNSLWREAGIDSRHQASVGGDSTPELTERTYNHVKPTTHEATAKLAAEY